MRFTTQAVGLSESPIPFCPAEWARKWIGRFSINWTLQYQMNRQTVVTGGYSHFFPGPFIEESGIAEGIHFGYIMIQYTF